MVKYYFKKTQTTKTEKHHNPGFVFTFNLVKHFEFLHFLFLV